MSDIRDYDCGLINPNGDVIDAVRFWVSKANEYWQDEADRFENEIDEKDSALAAANEQIAQLQATIRTQIEINDQQAGKIAQLQRELRGERECSWIEFLQARGIEPPYTNPCRACDGLGYRVYGSTATWHSGIGGQAITGDVCDKCWGSGCEEKPGTNLREIDKFQQERDALRAAFSVSEDKIKELNAKVYVSEKTVDEQVKRIKQLETIGRCPKCQSIVVSHATCDKCGTEAEPIIPAVEIAKLQQERDDLRCDLSDEQGANGVLKELNAKLQTQKENPNG